MALSSLQKEVIWTCLLAAVVLFLLYCIIVPKRAQGGEYIEVLYWAETGKPIPWAFDRGECDTYQLEICESTAPAAVCHRIGVQTWVQFWLTWTRPVVRCTDPTGRREPGAWVHAVRP